MPLKPAWNRIRAPTDPLHQHQIDLLKPAKLLHQPAASLQQTRPPHRPVPLGTPPEPNTQPSLPTPHFRTSAGETARCPTSRKTAAQRAAQRGSTNPSVPLPPAGLPRPTTPPNYGSRQLLNSQMNATTNRARTQLETNPSPVTMMTRPSAAMTSLTSAATATRNAPATVTPSAVTLAMTLMLKRMRTPYSTSPKLPVSRLLLQECPLTLPASHLLLQECPSTLPVSHPP